MTKRQSETVHLAGFQSKLTTSQRRDVHKLKCVHCLQLLGDAPTNIEPWAHGPCATEYRLQELGQRALDAWRRVREYEKKTGGSASMKLWKSSKVALDKYLKFRDSLPRRRVVPAILVPRPRKRRR